MLYEMISNYIQAPKGQTFVAVNFDATGKGKTYTYLTDSKSVKIGDTIETFNGEKLVVKNVSTLVLHEPWMDERPFAVLEQSFCIKGLKRPQWSCPEGTRLLKFAKDGKEFWAYTKLRFKVGQTIVTGGSRFYVVAEAKRLDADEQKRVVYFENQWGTKYTVVNEAPMATFTTNIKIMVKEERPLDGSLYIDSNNPEAIVIWQDLATKVFPEKLYIRSYKYLGEEQVKSLAKAHAYGSKIGVQIGQNQWAVLDPATTPKKRYDLKGEKLSSAELPEALLEMVSPASHRTFMEIMHDSKNPNKYMPQEAFELAKAYNSKVYNDLNEENHSVDFEEMNRFMKELYMACKDHVVVYIPLVLKIEAEAEAESKKFKIEPGQSLLSEEERAWLIANAKYYGINYDEAFDYVNTSFAKVGNRYAKWEEVRMTDLSQEERSRVVYDQRKHENFPKKIREGYLRTEKVLNYKKEKELYDQLKYYVDVDPEGFLDYNYKICPVCGQIYNINVGCECGFTEGCEISMEEYKARKEAEEKYNEQEEE